MLLVKFTIIICFSPTYVNIYTLAHRSFILTWYSSFPKYIMFFPIISMAYSDFHPACRRYHYIKIMVEIISSHPSLVHWPSQQHTINAPAALFRSISLILTWTDTHQSFGISHESLGHPHSWPVNILQTFQCSRFLCLLACVYFSLSRCFTLIHSLSTP